MKNREMTRAQTCSRSAKPSSLFWFACLLWLWNSAASTQALEVTGEQSGIWRKSDSPILVTGDVTIPNGATLTIEPGTLIQFNSYWTSINVQGTLNASGTAALPIVFTSVTDNKADQWGGLVFESGSSGTVQFAELRYGGGETEAMIQIDQARVTIQNTKFRNSGEDGIRIHTITDPQQVTIQRCDFNDNKGDGIECNSASPTITACTFSGNGNTAIWLSDSSYPVFQGDLTAEASGIFLRAATLQSSGRWMNAGIPFILDGDITISTNISLTIDPGVVIKGSSYWNSIYVQGQLTIAGTTNQPIKLTSYLDDSIAGDTNGDGTNGVPKGDQWGGIVFEPGSTGLVQNAEFRFGGGETEAMIQIDQARVSIHNVNFLNSGEDGIRIHTIADPKKVVIQQCVFRNNKGDGIECNDASPTIAGCAFYDNQNTAVWLSGTSFPDFQGDLAAVADGIWLRASTLERSGRWKYTGIPYILDGDIFVPTNISLTIDPGVVIKGSTYYNSIIVEGQLTIAGETNNPVILTSLRDDTIAGDTNGDTTNSVPKGDQWGGIRFETGSTGLVQNAEFCYGGGETEAMIQIDQAQVTIENTKFLSSGEDGIRMHTIANPQQVRIHHCDFADNLDDGIECNSASPTITASSFSGNGQMAIRLTGTSFPDFNGDLTADADGIHLRATTFTASGHWEYAGIPYILDGRIVVPTNIFLTIDPQVVIKGSSYWNSIEVQGQLTVAGETNRLVYLTSLADDSIAGDTNGDTTNSVPKGDQWGGIIFQAGSTGQVQNAEFRYGGGETEAMIQIDQAQVTIENTKFLSSGEDGIRMHTIANHQQVRIHHCDFTDNLDDGIECNSASPTITASSFSGNVLTAIRLTGTSFPDFNGDLTAATDGIHLRATTFTASGHWEYAGIPYILDGRIVVPTNIFLTIDPQVVIKGSSYWNSIEVQGQLTVAGETNRLVYLTSLADDSIAGDTNGDTTNSVPKGDQWGGIIFQAGSTGLVQNAEFRYGGGETEAMIQIDQAQVTIENTKFLSSGEDGIRMHTIANPQQVRIHHCDFTDNLDDGIECNSASPAILGCSFTGNGSTATKITGTSFPDFNGDLTAIADGIWVQATTLQKSGHWENTGVPYILNGDVYVPTNVSLTIDPGVVIKGSSYWNSIIVEGQLLVAGTSNRPVVMTSLQDDSIMGDTNGDTTNSVPKGDQWGGIVFSEGATGQVSFAEFRYGGGDTEAMIQIDKAIVSIDHAVFRFSGEDGLRMHEISDPALVKVNNSWFMNNREDGLEANSSSPTIQACHFAGNGGGGINLTGASFPEFSGDLTADREGIWLNSATFSRSGTYKYAGIPYILAGDLTVPKDYRLKIEPGVIIKGSSYWNSIVIEGQLEAVGTADRPIWFTSYSDDLGGDTNQDAQNEKPAQPKGNDWGGLIFQNSGSGTLSYVHLRFGGGETAGLIDIHNGQVYLSQCHLTDSGENGIYLGTYDLAGDPPAIHQCNISGNHEYGIRNASAKQVDATQVWWGHVSGPYHTSLNPAGLGDAVTDKVLFIPYLTVPIGTAVGPRITQHPKSQTVTVGQTALLTVVAEGNWPLAYQWYKGTNIIIGANIAVLEIAAAEMADAGDYQVRVKNEVSEAISQTATLTVLQQAIQDSDWTAQQVVLYNATEAELLARTGDIDNLNFGWPAGFDPFSGNSTPVHLYPWATNALDAPGTDRIMVVSSFAGTPPSGSDGYTGNSSRPWNRVTPVTMQFDLRGMAIQKALLQIFLDDVQPLGYNSRYSVTLDGTNASFIADQINQLNQHGPIGKLMTFAIPAEYHPLLADGRLEILIDDFTTGAGDGFAIDFARLLINPRDFTYKGTIQGKVVDSKSGATLAGAVVAIPGLAQNTTGTNGLYLLENVPAGLAVVQVAHTGYITTSKTVDLVSGQVATVDFALEASPVTEPIRITSIKVVQGHIELQWVGGKAPFALLNKSKLAEGAWQSVMETNERTVSIPRGGGTFLSSASSKNRLGTSWSCWIPEPCGAYIRVKRLDFGACRRALFLKKSPPT